MDSFNICKFIPNPQTDEVINTIHFVYETAPHSLPQNKLDIMYKVHVIISGKCELRLAGKQYHLKAGDIFFTFPSTPYTLISDKNLKYVYIGYIGLRANRIMEALKIDRYNCVVYDFEELTDFLLRYIQKIRNNNAKMLSESALLYIFSIISEREETEEEKDVGMGIAAQIKKYINLNYQDCELSLEKISAHFGYNKNYVAGVFKKAANISIGKYIMSIRIQNACTLADNNISSVKDIAYLCGFSDPLYFSKSFKKYIGQSPKDFIKNIKNSKQ
jgi:hypothetical protein